MTRFNGVYPALITPFTQDDRVNIPVLRDFVKYLLAKNVDGFYVCGSTGQGLSMSVAERKTTAEELVREVEGRVPVVVHVGATAYTDAVELAAHAQQIGASGLSSLIPPLYGSTDALRAYFFRIFEAAPDIALFPYLKGGLVDSAELLRVIEGIPNLAGTKITGPNMYELKRIVDMRPQPWSVFSGMDEQCIFAAMSGTVGNIGSSVNLIPGVYRRIHQLHRAGSYNEAISFQERANQVITILSSFGYSGALREAIGFLEFDVGGPRLPEPPFPSRESEKLRRELDEVGFRELVAM